MKANNLLSQFGDHRQRVQSAITAVCERRGILLVDDENRENEGDLIFSAQSMTETDMAIMIRHCSGIVCLCITEEKARQLNLPLMVEQNTSKYGTAFTISIEAAEGVTTGVSAADRIQTIRTAIAPQCHSRISSSSRTYIPIDSPFRRNQRTERSHRRQHRPDETGRTCTLCRTL